MPCCDSYDNGTAVGECKECGEPIDKDGEAIAGCYYSPIACSTCHHQLCDGSC